VRRRDVTITTTTLRVVVALRRHRLKLHDRERLVLRRPIAVGRALSPTPTGRYFLVETIAPPDPHGFYGPYALGLSAYSTVYTTFAGGNGQVGIHATNQASKLGTDVSHGCIRVDNATIKRLAKRLPLGTPVDIRRS
jgi:lipoprotein-anchoring transpeptidase ErfK/SrfK